MLTRSLWVNRPLFYKNKLEISKVFIYDVGEISGILRRSFLLWLEN